VTLRYSSDFLSRGWKESSVKRLVLMRFLKLVVLIYYQGLYTWNYYNIINSRRIDIMPLSGHKIIASFYSAIHFTRASSSE
jgi:hypothetical protein